MINSRVMSRFPRNSRGIGLIEVLVAMFVLAVGVLALGKMHSEYFGISSLNKARTEALAIAQGRLDDMRNYMHEADTLDEFKALYPVDTDGNLATIEGVNASFSRTETIAENGDLRVVAVTVDWVDATGETQNVTLDTELAFSSPRAPGALAAEQGGIVLPSPMGRARLGRGNVPAGVTPDSNNDGTGTFDADGNRNLVSGQKIVLTLEDACSTEDGECTDFVQIRGQVFIDKATQKSLDPQDVYVQASDAAYCSRYITVGDEAQPIEDITNNSLLLTESEDYYRFDYTCYLGGGWHGNIGILLASGLKQGDKICQGDPVSTNAWETPVIAARRAYRGMIYTKNADGTPVTTGDTGDRVYTSYGIADGVILPNPDSSDHSHDFVISSMSASSTEGSNCISQGAMVRADATSNGVSGDLFAGNPDDFVCLNDGYLDNYDTDMHGHEVTCPYDPTNPPVERHVISGSVVVSASPGNVISDEILNSIGVNTSDGPGNCLLDGFTASGGGYQAAYECDVYDWGLGWKGMLHTTAAENEQNIFCSPNPLEFATALTADISGQTISCEVGKYAVISGLVATDDPRRVLDSVTISSGECQIGSAGLSYECVSEDYSNVSTNWGGTLTFTLTGGVLCPATVTSSGILDLVDGVATADGISGENELNLIIQNNAGACP